MSDSPVEPSFNPIFSKFTDVGESQSLQGLVAYGLYKRAKREWATDLFHREGRKPNDAELTNYEHMWTASQIDGKWAEAEGALSEYADAIVEAATPDIEKRALRGSWPRAILYGVATNAIYTVILILLVVILKLVGVDVLGLAERIGPPSAPLTAKPSPTPTIAATPKTTP